MGKNYRFSIRLNPKNPDHREVAQMLDKLKRGQKAQLIVDAILICTGKKKDDLSDSARLKEILRSALSEVLNGQQTEKVPDKPVSPIPEKPAEPPEPKKDQDTILNSLSSFKF